MVHVYCEDGAGRDASRERRRVERIRRVSAGVERFCARECIQSLSSRVCAAPRGRVRAAEAPPHALPYV